MEDFFIVDKDKPNKISKLNRGLLNGKVEIVIPDEINGVKITHLGPYLPFPSSVKKIFLSDNISYVEISTFEVSNIEYIYIGKSLSFASFLEFSPSVKSVDVSPENQYLKVHNLNLYEMESQKLLKAKNTLILGDTKTIASYAFNELSLNNLELPKSVENISKCSFYQCDINKLTLPSSLTFIPPSALSECRINFLKIEDGVKPLHIAYNAVHCNINNLVLPERIKLERESFKLKETRNIEIKGGLVTEDSISLLDDNLVGLALNTSNIKNSRNLLEIGFMGIKYRELIAKNQRYLYMQKNNDGNWEDVKYW